MWVRSLGWEDPLEMATHFSILAWIIPWTEKPGGLQSMMGSQRVGHDYHIHMAQGNLEGLCPFDKNHH